MELPGHVNNFVHPGRLHFQDARSQRRLLPIPCSVLLRPERAAALLEAAGAIADRLYLRADDAGEVVLMSRPLSTKPTIIGVLTTLSRAESCHAVSLFFSYAVFSRQFCNTLRMRDEFVLLSHPLAPAFPIRCCR